jgi:hypothetical protein
MCPRTTEFAQESPVLSKGRLWVDEALILPTFESGAFAAEVCVRVCIYIAYINFIHIAYMN